jgi:hypothetical protein
VTLQGVHNEGSISQPTGRARCRRTARLASGLRAPRSRATSSRRGSSGMVDPVELVSKLIGGDNSPSLTSCSWSARRRVDLVGRSAGPTTPLRFERPTTSTPAADRLEARRAAILNRDRVLMPGSRDGLALYTRWGHRIVDEDRREVLALSHDRVGHRRAFASLRSMTGAIATEACLRRSIAIEREICRRSFAAFVERAWPTVEPTRALAERRPQRHHGPRSRPSPTLASSGSPSPSRPVSRSRSSAVCFHAVRVPPRLAHARGSAAPAYGTGFASVVGCASAPITAGSLYVGRVGASAGSAKPLRLESAALRVSS